MNGYKSGQQVYKLNQHGLNSCSTMLNFTECIAIMNQMS